MPRAVVCAWIMPVYVLVEGVCSGSQEKRGRVNSKEEIFPVVQDLGCKEQQLSLYSLPQEDFPLYTVS